MIAIRFPDTSFRIQQQKDKDIIFDALRKKWLLLTPEEWVRQNFIQYLIQIMHYPQSLIALEKEIVIGEVTKRFDIVVHSRNGKPWMLIECKAMDVPLSAHVTDQALRYNQSLQAPFLVVTNGTYTRCFQLQPHVSELGEMPVWQNE